MEAARIVQISSIVPYRVRDAKGRTHRLPPGTVTLDRRLRVKLGGKQRRLPGPLRFRPGRGVPLTLGERQYRGELRVHRIGDRVQVVNVLGLQPYLMGVVAREMPFNWPLEALKAQAVAARSYALARQVEGAFFDLYPDWRSQVYGGVADETPSTTRAVAETTGQVLLYKGRVATTFFHSTSGGRTAAAEDVYGPTIEAPYLVSVRDPWDAASPFHVWQPRPLSPRALGRVLALGGPVTDVIVERARSGRVISVNVTGAGGASRRFSGNELRDALGLRSTLFRIGVLRLAADRRAVPAGDPVELAGVARDVGRVRLETLRNGLWTRLRNVAVGRDGTFVTVVRPEQPARYRLVAGDVAGAPVVVNVRPKTG